MVALFVCRADGLQTVAVTPAALAARLTTTGEGEDMQVAVGKPMDIDVHAVKFDATIYPRAQHNKGTVATYKESFQAGATFPPILIEAETGRLLDGKHRWLAAQEAGVGTLSACAVTVDMPKTTHDKETGEEIADPKYTAALLCYATQVNAEHGDRVTNDEKKKAMRAYVESDEAANITDMASRFGVGNSTAYRWVDDILTRRKHQENLLFWWLGGVLGWTQEEVAEFAAVPRETARNRIGHFSQMVKTAKDKQARGRTPQEIAEAEQISLKLTETLLIDGTDAERLEWLNIGIQPYDVWHFQACDDRFGNTYPGRIPGQLIVHLLYLYTEQGDTVVDPMVGSGTTIDACAYMGRTVYGYDAHPTTERDDIIKHNMATDGWPARTGKAKLVFWDPPYYKKKDDGYGDQSVSRLSRDEYMAFFAEAARGIPDGFKGRLAFLCSDFNDEKDPSENIFFWDYVKLFEDAGWVPERRIQVPLSTQQVHPDIVLKFREQRRLARLNRDLVVLHR